MQIKTTKLAAGPKGVRKAGTEISVSKKEGEAMIASGDGVAVAGEKAAPKKADKKDDPAGDGDDESPPKRDADIETAATEDDERAASRTGRKAARWTRGGKQ